MTALLCPHFRVLHFQRPSVMHDYSVTPDFYAIPYSNVILTVLKLRACQHFCGHRVCVTHAMGLIFLGV